MHESCRRTKLPQRVEDEANDPHLDAKETRAGREWEAATKRNIWDILQAQVGLINPQPRQQEDKRIEREYVGKKAKHKWRQPGTRGRIRVQNTSD